MFNLVPNAFAELAKTELETFDLDLTLYLLVCRVIELFLLHIVALVSRYPKCHKSVYSGPT